MWNQKKWGATFAPDHYLRRYAIFDRAVTLKELYQAHPLAAGRSRTSDMRSWARLETALQWSPMPKHIGDHGSPRQDLKLPNSGHQCPYTLATHGCPEKQPSLPEQYPQQAHLCPKQDSRLSQANTGPEGLCSTKQQSPQPRPAASNTISRPRQDDIAQPVTY